jgi:hypothetical protein
MRPTVDFKLGDHDEIGSGGGVCPVVGLFLSATSSPHERKKEPEKLSFTFTSFFARMFSLAIPILHKTTTYQLAGYVC